LPRTWRGALFAFHDNRHFVAFHFKTAADAQLFSSHVGRRTAIGRRGPARQSGAEDSINCESSPNTFEILSHTNLSGGDFEDARARRSFFSIADEVERIRQLATSLLLSRGLVEKGGLDEFHYRNRVAGLLPHPSIETVETVAVLPSDGFAGDDGKERNFHLYETTANETVRYDWILKLAGAEELTT
jgi:hypothetical protein